MKVASYVFNINLVALKEIRKVHIASTLNPFFKGQTQSTHKSQWLHYSSSSVLLMGMAESAIGFPNFPDYITGQVFFLKTVEYLLEWLLSVAIIEVSYHDLRVWQDPIRLEVVFSRSSHAFLNEKEVEATAWDLSKQMPRLFYFLSDSLPTTSASSSSSSLWIIHWWCLICATRLS